MPEDSPFKDPTIIKSKVPNLENEPTIKILLYTDDPTLVVRQIAKDFGLGSMISHLETHQLAFANISITLKSRYPQLTAKPVQRINRLLEDEEKTEAFDQVWFFGVHQINKKSFSLGIGGGGPDSELDKDEVEALRIRMDAGRLGVLVTGDHANHRPPDAVENENSPCADEARRERFLGLGRALSRCIPRAGQLRDWEGEPTANPRHSINTQVVMFAANIDTETRFQEDQVPQQLILKTFNDAGRPSREGHPHPLFLYKKGGAIQLFPDHLHEGETTIPKELNNEWITVNGIRPKPRIIAFGLDKRNGKKFKLMAAYDGDAVDAGRIVADSSWHHYFNENLRNFPPQSRVGLPADQIGQFYANLVLWLTPKHKRKKMADTMSLWLAQQPTIAELAGPVPSQHIDIMVNTGRMAKLLLAEVASDCEIHELLQMIVPDRYMRRHQSLYFPEKRFTLSPLPSKDLLLGSLIHVAPNEMPESLMLTMSSAEAVLVRRNAMASATEIAFKKQQLRIAGTAKLAQKLFGDNG